jgi:hypothetical protein
LNFPNSLLERNRLSAIRLPTANKQAAANQMAKLGRGRDNKFTVDGEWIHAGQLFDPRQTESFTLSVGDREFKLFRERTLPGFVHALSPEEIKCQLAVVAPDDLSDRTWFAQLQSTRKHDILTPA